MGAPDPKEPAVGRVFLRLFFLLILLLFTTKAMMKEVAS